ncbi:MAG: hypothetical protein KC493_11320 [Bacteriovoracaceae bacterium]|nr:hypothetical protein [Bacteriovoracaceae bacterium]
MDFFDIVKLTARKSPLPTLAAALVYGIFIKVLDKCPSDTVTISIVFLTFVLSLGILTFGSLKKNTAGLTNNELSEVVVDDGDAFIGHKSDEPAPTTEIKDNKISKVKVTKGDVFIGSKKDS